MNDVPFLDLAALHAPLRARMLEAFARVYDSGRYSGGEEVQAFEKDFADWHGVAHAVGLRSGTSALHLALRALDVGEGDEVITVAHTFVATAWAIRYCGATPRFVDVDPRTRCMDVAAAEAAIGPRTKVLLPVHLYGQPADLGSLRALADRHGLHLVEDAAQAHGAIWNGQRAGSVGDIACFSFYPGKNLGALGEGGALLTAHPAIAERVRRLRDHGQSRRYHHEELGFNDRMDAIQAAALRLKLAELERWNARRQEIAASYDRAFAPVERGFAPFRVPGTTSAHHLYVVQHPERDALARRLARRGIQTGLHYPVPVHRQPAFADLGLGEGSLPVTEHLARTCLSLPMGPTLSDAEVSRVTETVLAELAEPVVELSLLG